MSETINLLTAPAGSAGKALVELGKRIDHFVAALDRSMWNWTDAAAKAERMSRLLAVEQISVPFKDLAAGVLGAEKTRMALFITAPHHQGGHSRAGAAIADALGVPFPIAMADLLTKAREEEIDPALLWPWLVQQSPGLFTAAELAVAGRA